MISLAYPKFDLAGLTCWRERLVPGPLEAGLPIHVPCARCPRALLGLLSSTTPHFPIVASCMTSECSLVRVLSLLVLDSPGLNPPMANHRALAVALSRAVYPDTQTVSKPNIHNGICYLTPTVPALGPYSSGGGDQQWSGDRYEHTHV